MEGNGIFAICSLRMLLEHQKRKLLYFGFSIPWFSPAEKIVKNKNAPGELVPTLRGQILCTGIFHLVPNILIHYNRDRKKVPT